MKNKTYISIPNGLYDIVGDIHGEFNTLLSLLSHLGYDKKGNHPQKRKLIFVGDLCDRGEDSAAVILFVKHLISKKKAYAVLGNHEIMALNQEPHEGGNWILNNGNLDDKFLPYKKVKINRKKKEILNFLNSLPIVIESENFQIVHACWHQESVDSLKKIKYFSNYWSYNLKKELYFENSLTKDFKYKLNNELNNHKQILNQKDIQVPFLPYVAEYELNKQNHNPITILTYGINHIADKPRFIANRWKFTLRDDWWNKYPVDKKTFIGHYWRKKDLSLWSLNHYLFSNEPFNSYVGINKNVFCVDFSIGAKHIEKQANQSKNTMARLAAIRYPEDIIIFENGEQFNVIS